MYSFTKIFFIESVFSESNLIFCLLYNSSIIIFLNSLSEKLSFSSTLEFWLISISTLFFSSLKTSINLDSDSVIGSFLINLLCSLTYFSSFSYLAFRRSLILFNSTALSLILLNNSIFSLILSELISLRSFF